MTSTHLETERDPSLTQLVTGIIGDTEELLKQQLKLVKVEVKNDVQGYITAAIPMVIGAIGMLIASIVLAFAAAHALVAIWPSLPLWGAYAIVGGLLAVVCGAFIAWAANKFSSVKFLDQTEAGMKENMQWKTKS